MSSDPAGIDLTAVTAWCEAELGVTGPLRLTRIGAGRSNLTFRVEDAAGTTFVLRRPPRGPLLPKAHDMTREFRVLGAMSAAGIRVPRPLALCTEEAVNGKPFYAMESVAGHVVDSRAAAERFDPAARRQMGLSLMEVLAEIHAVDVDAVGLGELGPRENYVQRQIRRMRRQWEVSRDADLPLVEELGDRLERLAPAQPSVSLVHGDCHLGNVMVDEGGEVVAVLDWELCALGDPLADIGYVLAYWGEPGSRSPLDDGTFQLPGFASDAELAAHYASVSGRDVAALPFFRVLALWKLAVIDQGVIVRERRAGASREGLREVPPPDLLAEAALRAGSDGGLW